MKRPSSSTGWLRARLFSAAASAGLCACVTTSTTPDSVAPDLPRLETARAAAASIAPALADENPAARRRAVLALARLERLDAMDGILKALSDPDGAVRATAAFAAGQIDLALDGTRPAHEERRGVVEAALVRRLQTEQDREVRLALIRALGRVAARQGLDALIALATTPTAGADERAAAFFALGVSGRRRTASRSRDDALRAAVEQGLGSGEAVVVEGAAYAALGQKLVVAPAAADAASRSPSAQARIYIARAATVDPATVDVVIPRLLHDADWRVRVEAVRAARARGDALVDRLPVVLDTAVQRAAKPGELHVVRETCLALADVGAPVSALPAVEAAARALPSDAHAAGCACASAVEILGGDPDAVETCTSSLPEEQRRKHAIETIEHARISSLEKSAALASFFDDADVRVRGAAAAALCKEPTVAAADAAAKRLLVEDDPGVADTLLQCFTDGQNADVIRDRTIIQAAQRFLSSPAPESIEVLVSIAALARARPTLGPLGEQLKAHADARVRDAAEGVPPGERSPGPRAVVVDVSPATLPLAAVLKTTRGEIVIAFERELAPIAVRTFVDLAQRGAYKGTRFHRVIADFVAQGGDPRGDGAGGPGFSIPCENSDAPFTRGAVGIATAGKDTGGSQFFLTHSDQPHLDGRYTLFARVTDGLDVMDALQKDDVLLDVEITTALRKTPR